MGTQKNQAYFVSYTYIDLQLIVESHLKLYGIQSETVAYPHYNNMKMMTNSMVMAMVIQRLDEGNEQPVFLYLEMTYISMYFQG
ncbi:unnamed protein product [Schistosoma mattheei]|uniref:Uncharacterized protein n=1 Tax=Schistosoma mattheei TaxID=31246 RepID=A0A3P7X8B8_9TREM|nr:unnamed protein product [Schistosoma mattheei]